MTCVASDVFDMRFRSEASCPPKRHEHKTNKGTSRPVVRSSIILFFRFLLFFFFFFTDFTSKTHKQTTEPPPLKIGIRSVPRCLNYTIWCPMIVGSRSTTPLPPTCGHSGPTRPTHHHIRTPRAFSRSCPQAPPFVGSLRGVGDISRPNEREKKTEMKRRTTRRRCGHTTIGRNSSHL